MSQPYDVPFDDWTDSSGLYADDPVEGGVSSVTEPVTRTSSRREVLVAGAVKRWRNELMDLSGRNDLLFCKTGNKVNLDKADPKTVAAFLAGRTVSLTELYPGSESSPQFQQVVKHVKNMRKRIKMYAEEKAVQVGRVAIGLAVWQDEKGRTPLAPIFFRGVDVHQPHPGVDLFTFTAHDDAEMNPVLLQLLREHYEIDVTPEMEADFLDLMKKDRTGQQAIASFTAIMRQAPGGVTHSTTLIGTFQYQKLSMVQDMGFNVARMVNSDLVSALAADDDAITAIRATGSPVDSRLPDRTPPSEDFLVLDADPSQQFAINAVLAGQNVVLEGPPGTGKSQTVSNLIASLMAKGKTVLFVAEKRAAIDAVVKRLTAAGLGGVVLDLHDGGADKARVVAHLNAARQRPESGSLAVAGSDAVEASRRVLLDHATALHEVREPWKVSLFDVQSALLPLNPASESPHRLPNAALNGMSPNVVAETRAMLREFAELGGFLPVEQRGPWAKCRPLTQEGAEAVFTTAKALQDALPALVLVAGRLETVGLRVPEALADVPPVIVLLAEAGRELGKWSPSILTVDLNRLSVELAEKNDREDAVPKTTWGSRRAALKDARDLRVDEEREREVLHADVLALLQVMGKWREASGGRGVPVVYDGVFELREVFTDVVALAEDVFTTLRDSEFPTLGWDELSARVNALTSDPAGLTRSRRLNTLREQIEGHAPGVGTVVAKKAHAAPMEYHVRIALETFDYVLCSSIIDQIIVTDEVAANSNGVILTRAAAAFRESDRAHQQMNTNRILSMLSRRTSLLRTQNKDQDRLLDKELKKKSRIKPVRELLLEAPDILLSAMPCWIMSPLDVTRLLPHETNMFDVVIFDESSQIKPADAISALARARNACIAGDSKQLPPTRFFEGETGGGAAPESVEDGSEVLTEDVESLLHAMHVALGGDLSGQYYLRWHYRSEDPRLIEFSNRWFYDSKLITFPGVSVRTPLSFVHVPWTPQGSVNVDSSDAEVNAVVDLVIRHARTAPEDSLGVITMGIVHSDRIQAALEKRLADPANRDVLEFFSDANGEPFFVKNLERVQGDERDSIIISIGYTKNEDGRLLYRFGPINDKGGERRLNVAVSRAKRNVTLVASFTAADMDPARLTAEGSRALHGYLKYAASGGQDFGNAVPAAERRLTRFEQDLMRRLTSRGVTVHPRWGVSGYFIDFALAHPAEPGRMVLAVEADGPGYYATETTRARDRLRQEHLERLGWSFHRVWSSDYFRDPEGVVDGIVAAYEAAVNPPAVTEPGGVSGPSVRPGAAPAEAAAVPRGPRPDFTAGLALREYSDDTLQAVVRWVESDGVTRDDRTLMVAAAMELGFTRRDPAVADRIGAAIRALYG